MLNGKKAQARGFHNISHPVSLYRFQTGISGNPLVNTQQQHNITTDEQEKINLFVSCSKWLMSVNKVFIDSNQ